MAKKGKRIVDEVRETLKVSEQSDPEAHGFEKAAPTKPPCPRCGTFDTTSYRTVGIVQYRKCRRATCRHNYSCVLKVAETRS